MTRKYSNSNISIVLYNCGKARYLSPETAHTTEYQESEDLIKLLNPSIIFEKGIDCVFHNGERWDEEFPVKMDF